VNGYIQSAFFLLLERTEQAKNKLNTEQRKGRQILVVGYEILLLPGLRKIRKAVIISSHPINLYLAFGVSMYA